MTIKSTIPNIITEPVEEGSDGSLRKRFVNALCGSSDKVANMETSYDIVEEHSSRIASLWQSKNWKMFMNVNAVVLAVFTAFLYGFFH